MRTVLVLGLLLWFPGGARASFHLMQVEQFIGGVGGDSQLQVIQLRLRGAGQSLVSGARLVARDASGANPVVVVDLGTNVTNSAAGTRVLIASAAFAATFGPTPDFTMTSTVPATYLPAGRLTFESDAGTVYWSLAWGGAGYTGSHAGAIDNDADGNFGPAFAGPAVWTAAASLRFSGGAGAQSTNNAADYALSSPAQVHNNSGQSMLFNNSVVFGDDFETGGATAWAPGAPKD